MDVIDTLERHWALTTDDGQPLTCHGEIVFGHSQTADGLQRELEVLTAQPPRRAVQCSHANHWHLQPLRNQDEPTRQQQRHAVLLRALLTSPREGALRMELRDAIDWGDTCGKTRRKYFNYALSVLENYGLIIRDGDRVCVDDSDALAALCHAIPEWHPAT